MSANHVIRFKEIYDTTAFFRRLRASLAENPDEILICSPYFDSLPKPFRDILAFCAVWQRRGVDLIRIITAPPGSNSSSMPVSVARRLAAINVELFIYRRPTLHAKLYHFEYQHGNFRSFVGSANFTVGGLVRNHDLVAELNGVGKRSPCHREIESMLASRDTMKYEAWAAKHLPNR